MRIMCLQHVAFEGPALLQPLLEQAGHQLTICRLFEHARMPLADRIDGLLVMGGPMGVHDQDQFPWLADEVACIRQAIDAGKPVLGICLGAQLIAHALGAEVRSGTCREIGWFPVERDPAVEQCWLNDYLPATFTPLHWHSDRFEIPDGALALGASEACNRQGFLYHERVLALQFHLEITEQSLDSLISHCADELDNSRWVQTPAQLRENPHYFSDAHQLLERLTVHLFSNA